MHDSNEDDASSVIEEEEDDVHQQAGIADLVKEESHNIHFDEDEPNTRSRGPIDIPEVLVGEDWDEMFITLSRQAEVAIRADGVQENKEIKLLFAHITADMLDQGQGELGVSILKSCKLIPHLL